MAPRQLSTSGWLTEGAADTSEMAQFGVGGNKRCQRVPSTYCVEKLEILQIKKFREIDGVMRVTKYPRV